jgi:hypothetical protein
MEIFHPINPEIGAANPAFRLATPAVFDKHNVANAYASSFA